MCSILYLKSVGTLWLSPHGLFTGLLGFPYHWNKFWLPFFAVYGTANWIFMFALDFFHMKFYMAIIWVYKSLLSWSPLILFYYSTTFPSGLHNVMVRLPKFIPLLTGIRLNQGLLSFCTLSIHFYIKGRIAWLWGKRLQFPVNCNSRIKDLCKCLETFCSSSFRFLLPSNSGSEFHYIVPHGYCFQANRSEEFYLLSERSFSMMLSKYIWKEKYKKI